MRKELRKSRATVRAARAFYFGPSCYFLCKSNFFPRNRFLWIEPQDLWRQPIPRSTNRFGLSPATHCGEFANRCPGIGARNLLLQPSAFRNRLHLHLRVDGRTEVCVADATTNDQRNSSRASRSHRFRKCSGVMAAYGAFEDDDLLVGATIYTRSLRPDWHRRHTYDLHRLQMGQSCKKLSATVKLCGVCFQKEKPLTRLVRGSLSCLLFLTDKKSRSCVHIDDQLRIASASAVNHVPDELVLARGPIEQIGDRCSGDLVSSMLLRDFIGFIGINLKEGNVERICGGISVLGARRNSARRRIRGVGS